MSPSFSQIQKQFYDKEFKKIVSKKMEENITNFYFEKIKDIIDANTAIKDGSKFLEVGVGNGMLMERMERHFNRCVFKGVDISEKHVDIAKQKGLDVKMADVACLDLSEKYDFIYGTSILHHLEDAPKFLKDASTMLNEGGAILFGAENVSCEFIYIIYHILRGVWEIEKGMMKLSPGKIRNYLKDDYYDINIY